MERVFTRNMFIMLLSIMVGAIIITYFVADIQNRMRIETLTTEHNAEITNIQSKNENFTSNFMKATVILDQAREDRAWGNHYFDLAFIWYKSALSENNITNMEKYKKWTVENCTEAMPNYLNSNNNFLESSKRFEKTKNYTDYNKYHEILDLYVKLTKTGVELTQLRYNASNYLQQLANNITVKIVNNTIVISLNTTAMPLLKLFDTTMAMFMMAEKDYADIQEELDEYELFDEIR